MKDDWHSIETAPRGKPLLGENGPRIMLGWEHIDHIVIGSFSLGTAPINHPMWRDGYGGAIIKPTHWMPLPDPPKSTKPST